jgi:prepilin-type N-terminal cleavage/methylation domain-containing protein
MESKMATQKRLIKCLGTDNEGFTLIEVLMAMVVATIGLLGLAMMQSYAIQGNATGSKYTKATFLAQQQLELIKEGNIVKEGTFGYIDMDNYSGSGTMDSGPTESGIDENGESGGPFNRSWAVLTSTDWARRIVVTVTWQGAGGITRRVQLESLSRGDGN